MARIIDDRKLAGIHEATIEFVVSHGYGGASISAIAKKAGVAEGYLYRFYDGKQSLVVSLLNAKIAGLIQKLEEYLTNYQEIRKIIELLINDLFQMAENNPDEIKFIHVLMHDYNFQVSDQQRLEIKSLCERVIRQGVENRELSPTLSPEEVYNMVILYPIEFINLRIKGFFGSNKWSKDDIRSVISFSLKALR